jgi:hypothetical protein
VAASTSSKSTLRHRHGGDIDDHGDDVHIAMRMEGSSTGGRGLIPVFIDAQRPDLLVLTTGRVDQRAYRRMVFGLV